MAESSIGVQPATQQGPAPAPVQLKMFTIVGPDGTSQQIQAVCLVDDNGRAYFPLSEATGRQLVQLMRTLVELHVSGLTGGLYPPDDLGLDE